jgi:ATP-binding cassette subfamily B multidrug efflux pump
LPGPSPPGDIVDVLRNLRRLIPYFRPYWATYALGLGLVIISNRLITYGPRFIEQGVNALAAGHDMAGVRRAALLLLGTALAGGIARYGMRQTLNSGSRWVEYDLRNDLFRHLQTLSADFYDRAPTGDLMARLTNDLLAVRMAAGPAVMYLVDTFTRAVIVVPMMVAISPRLTELALLPVAGLPLVMILFGQAIHVRSLAIQDHFSELTRFVHENISGVRVVRAYRQEPAESRTFEGLSDEYARRNIALARAAGAFNPLLTLLGGLGGVVVLYVGGRDVMAGQVTAGAFVAFGVYLATLVWPLIALGWVVNLLNRGEASMGRLNALLAERPSIVSPVPALPLPEAAGARRLTFEGVWFRYPNAHDRGWVLQDITFDLAAGRSLAVVGATGSGKSTLADLIVRNYDPDRGRILLDGVDIRTLDLRELRRAVGFVPQDTFLFSETLRENVLLGAPDDGRLERAAGVSQLAAALPSLPSGYDTMLGERGINLSGGQKQRAAIARALAQEPPVFVLDDALSAVDAQTEARILGALRGALAGRTSVVISHRLAAVRDADRILVLDAGRVVEEGTHATLAAKRGRYWELLWRQEVEEELEEVVEGELGTGNGERSGHPPFPVPRSPFPL